MKPEYNLGELISVLRTDIVELVNTKLELLKLETLEKTSKLGSFMIYGLIVMNLVFFALLFAFIALGFLIGDWIHSTAGGFAVVTLIYLMILAILFACRKSILTGFQNLFLKELDPSLEDEIRYEEREETLLSARAKQCSRIYPKNAGQKHQH
ncbi:MAG: phage holin family protein [Candidatus Symbiothrix sp.]|jgi:uncharacterized membrane protein YqjE|nr:phage holin family protein [Candidatus Symbiothrix sp.]